MYDSERVPFRPINDRVLLKRADPETKAGSIILPDVAQKQNVICVVVAIGPGKRNQRTGEVMPTQLIAGDRVMIRDWVGSEIKLDGDEYCVIREDEVMGVLAP